MEPYFMIDPTNVEPNLATDPIISPKIDPSKIIEAFSMNSNVPYQTFWLDTLCDKEVLYEWTTSDDLSEADWFPLPKKGYKFERVNGICQTIYIRAADDGDGKPATDVRAVTMHFRY